MKATSIRLNDRREQTLTELAAKLKCHNSAGEPSWRVMLNMIADGFIKVTNPLDKSRQLYINFLKPPGWWRGDADGSMLAADVAKKYKTTVEILEEKGFVVDGDRIYPGNWKGWRAVEDAKKATPEEVAAQRELARRDELAKMPVPDWFVRCPGMMAMILENAVEASGMSPGEMRAAGMVIRRVSGCDVVSGPVGSEWAYEVPIPEVQP